MPTAPPHLRGLRLRSVVRIDVHGSEDRAKDASPGACDDLSCLRRVHAHRSRMRTAFPSSAASGHPLSSASLVSAGGLPTARVGPTEVLVPTTLREERRHPKDRDAFHRHDTWRNSSREGIAPSGLHAGSLAHAAHTGPRDEGSVFDGHCKVTVRSPADP
jgi:hypothetical protein